VTSTISIELNAPLNSSFLFLQNKENLKPCFWGVGKSEEFVQLLMERSEFIAKLMKFRIRTLESNIDFRNYRFRYVEKLFKIYEEHKLLMSEKMSPYNVSG